ncbi:MAG: leucyl aminopeptidase [Chloroflexi bacterium]|nr:leucyl aminopeptidase [Chloroflexota bacterium]
MRGRTIGEGINVARSLAIEPGNRMTPTILAERSCEIAREVGLHCDIVDADRLAILGAGALLGVARGSDEPPCLIVLRYVSPSPTTTTLAIVGKGVTFDSGGISIKPAQNMHEMKYDMCGAAAALGAMHAIARLAPPINVLGIVPATENLLSGRAMKPGDILRAMNGISIEILNTDAEGRLILADAIVHAQHLGATHIVDAATLTGACVVALGEHASGLFAAPDEWLDTVRQAAGRAGERVWPLPLFPEYREQLKSDVADIANVGGRTGGACTAAAFIRAFVRADVPWAHLDIAGTSHTSADRPYQAAGPTGAATRLFIELALCLGPAAAT